jgi:hypothetical protein
MHPDNELALNVMMKFLQHFRQDFLSEDTGDFSPSGSFVCFGGPISNARTASFLGYSAIDPSRPALGMRRENCPLDLGIEFEVDAAVLIRKGLIVRGGIHNDPTPQWGIRFKDGEVLETQAGKIDYLLVSRVPNWIERQLDPNKKSNGVVTIVAGCHGAGVNSVRLLLYDGVLLKKLDDLTREHRYWQALIKVEHIENRVHPITNSVRHMALSLSPTLIAVSPVRVS